MSTTFTHKLALPTTHPYDLLIFYHDHEQVQVIRGEDIREAVDPGTFIETHIRANKKAAAPLLLRIKEFKVMSR